LTDGDLDIRNADPTLHNADLAPVPAARRSWGWFEIFNVWANDVQSLFGYTLAASLFFTHGPNGWAVLAGIVAAGLVVAVLVNLTGQPSQRYGIPYPVMARASMGVRGANLPAMTRGIVAIFWYGVQTYFASTALVLLITAVTGIDGGDTLLGMTAVGWSSFAAVWAFQITLFWHGIDWIRRFLNFAGPAVYLVMITLAIVIVARLGGDLFAEFGPFFAPDQTSADQIAVFITVTGTMIAYFAAVVINFGDFSRFVRSERDMKIGNLLGLPLNMLLFAVLALMITAGATALIGEPFTNPTEIVAHVDSLLLTILAAIVFFTATVGINLVANFIPPAYDLANLWPAKITFRIGGLITAIASFFIGALWVSVISRIGITGFVNTLGAVLAPVYGIMVLDYYLIKSGRLDIGALFSADPAGAYWYQNGWNLRALAAWLPASAFSIATVWLPRMSDLSGFGWLIGALLGAAFYWAAMRIR
jgi:NCS1 family nucleobase:cation symporter-1